MRGQEKVIAFFDLDGTLTVRDTLPDFIAYTLGRHCFLRGIIKLAPILAGYFAGLIPNSIAKERLLTHFFANMELDQFRESGAQYARRRLPTILRPAGVDRLSWHLAAGHEVVVVSASIESWIEEWSRPRGIGLLATRLEVNAEGRLTGFFATPNCHGEEKVRRILANYSLEHYDQIFAYGDSKGDREMLALAHAPSFKPFR